MVKYITYGLHEHEALGVGDDLGGVKGLLKVGDELLAVTGEVGGGALELLASAGTLGLEGRKAAREDGLADEGYGLAHVEGVDGGPLAGTLLASRVEDLLEERGSVIVVEVHDVAGDLDEERVKHTLVPLGEDIANLLVGHANTTLHDVVGLINCQLEISARNDPECTTDLGDELHVTVLDTVVNHLDVVASTLVTDPLAAGLAVRLGGDVLEDVLDVRPGLLVTTGHDGGTVAGTLLATRDTGTDEADALGVEVLGAAVGVGEVRVATVNDDVALLQTVLEEELNEVVDGLAGHDEKHHAAGSLELGDELLDAVRANNALSLGLVLEELVNLGDSAVEGNDGVAVVGGVEDQVLAHDRKANETEVSTVRARWSAAVSPCCMQCCCADECAYPALCHTLQNFAVTSERSLLGAKRSSEATVPPEMPLMSSMIPALSLEALPASRGSFPIAPKR
jgi:hypothetical protein